MSLSKCKRYVDSGKSGRVPENFLHFQMPMLPGMHMICGFFVVIPFTVFHSTLQSIHGFIQVLLFLQS